MKTIITILMLTATVTVKAQGIGSFFTQQADKAKIMMEQIALQTTYLSEIKKGYGIVENGLNSAHNLKNGSFTLNQNYFQSLSQVSPAIATNPKIKLIADYQQQLTAAFGNELSWQKQQSVLKADEIGYMQSVYDNLAKECSRDLTELKMIITPGTAQLKDEERIQRIDKLYDAAISKYQFSMTFINRAHVFALDRKNDHEQRQKLKVWYGIDIK